MDSAWDKASRFAERTEIIDIKEKEVLWKQWERFIVRTYLDCTKDFINPDWQTTPEELVKRYLNRQLMAYGLRIIPSH